MEIKSYKKCSNNRYEVSLSNGEKYKIYDDLILKYELLINKNINNKRLEELLDENKLYDAYYQAISYIAYKMRSKKEIKDYLKKKDYSTYDIAYTIDTPEIIVFFNSLMLSKLIPPIATTGISTL